jgi:hypothetical protein
VLAVILMRGKGNTVSLPGLLPESQAIGTHGSIAWLIFSLNFYICEIGVSGTLLSPEITRQE